MKKILFTLAIAFTAVGAFAGEEKVAPRVLDAFQHEFTSAREVEWTIGSDHYMATFTYYGRHVFAYYNTDGDLLGLTRYITADMLSMNLQSSLKRNYADFWVSDLFEVAKKGNTDYYITLENADKKIVLHSENGSDWAVFRKVRKA